MDIGIIGAGAIGGWVAARLALAGNKVSVLARGDTLSALADGLSVNERGTRERAEVHASSDPARLGAQELLRDEDVEAARAARRDDLPGRPLAWHAAMRTLVEGLMRR